MRYRTMETYCDDEEELNEREDEVVSLNVELDRHAWEAYQHSIEGTATGDNTSVYSLLFRCVAKNER